MAKITHDKTVMYHYYHAFARLIIYSVLVIDNTTATITTHWETMQQMYDAILPYGSY